MTTTMTTAGEEQQFTVIDRKDHHPSSGLRIHISCATSSFDDSSSPNSQHHHGGAGHGHPVPPSHLHHHLSHHSHRSVIKSVTKQNNNANGGSSSPPSPAALATNFHAVHPSAKYHPLARHAQKPLSTYTSLGTPIPRVIVGGGTVAGAGGQQRPRSLSLGSNSCCLAVKNTTILCNHHHQHNNSNSHNNNGNGSPHLHHPDLLFMSVPLPQPEVPTPPRLAARRQAEAAEQARTVALEQTEVNYDADELRLVLKKERTRMQHIQADLIELRSGLAQEQLQAEVLEEECINGLVVRLDHLQEEKARIVLEEREQEMVRGTARMYVFVCYRFLLLRSESRSSMHSTY